LYVKDLDPNQTSVEFTETKGLIKFKTNDLKFLSDNNTQDTSTLFEWDVDFYGSVQASNCKYKVNRMNLEINLRKSNQPSEVKWRSAIKRRLPNDDDKESITSSASSTSSSTSNVQTKQEKMESAKSFHISRPKSRSRSLSSSPSPPPTPVPQQQQQTVTAALPPRISSSNNAYYGYTGLVNLGNTCYMNAALQFIVNATELRDYFLETPHLFQKEINMNNALGVNGKMAIAFAMLLRQLWTSNTSSITPNKLRDLICFKYAHFRGYEQQDTQEFMCSFLSILHEDLNRVTKKPYYESSLECEDDSMANTYHIANESWKRFLSRENSVIVDNFYGQFKSKLTCPECHKVSITFEPFSNLLVPLAKPKIWVSLILVFHSSKKRNPIKVVF
jgi:ubiquitin C-terminal hydrolase